MSSPRSVLPIQMAMELPIRRMTVLQPFGIPRLCWMVVMYHRLMLMQMGSPMSLMSVRPHSRAQQSTLQGVLKCSEIPMRTGLSMALIHVLQLRLTR